MDLYEVLVALQRGENVSDHLIELLWTWMAEGRDHDATVLASEVTSILSLRGRLPPELHATLDATAVFGDFSAGPKIHSFCLLRDRPWQSPVVAELVRRVVADFERRRVRLLALRYSRVSATTAEAWCGSLRFVHEAFTVDDQHYFVRIQSPPLSASEMQERSQTTTSRENAVHTLTRAIKLI